ncbi:YbaB/EbfC family nucleoid-associated protein [Actinoplanes sp. NPDC051494]|uniref:YbaB/EbfC family nucleoid-associated protein n=1 Tax=Actinoplanes sp. NPDC051494 TaxID=3363907 RepID=UPI00378D6089
MPGDEIGRLSRLFDDNAVFQRQAGAAAAAASEARGTDATGSVTVTVSAEGRVAAVRIDAGWRAALEPGTLGDAVRAAAQEAALARIALWGAAFGADTRTHDVALLDPEQVRALSSGRMSGADSRAALLELLAMAEDLERGIDEVSAGLAAARAAIHTGRSADQRVTVTVTGAGEVGEIRYDRRWLRDAHEFGIGRQTMAAFTAAYSAAARDGADAVIAASRLGELQRVTRDPAELARRLRLDGGAVR